MDPSLQLEVWLERGFGDAQHRFGLQSWKALGFCLQLGKDGTGQTWDARPPPSRHQDVPIPGSLQVPVPAQQDRLLPPSSSSTSLCLAAPHCTEPVSQTWGNQTCSSP